MGKREDLSGKKFNMLTIVEDAEDYISPIGKRFVRVKALCDCGNYTIANKSAIKNGTLKSCGCLHKKSITKHGLSKTPAYRRWGSIKARCNNKNSNHYADYGGRGIKVCRRWLKFDNFQDDMGERPKGTSIDRINNNGNYEPSNCKWSTKKEQSNNRRNNIVIKYKGNEKTITEWARHFKINESTFYYRYKNKMPLEKMMSKKNYTGNNQYINKLNQNNGTL